MENKRVTTQRRDENVNSFNDEMGQRRRLSNMARTKKAKTIRSRVDEWANKDKVQE